MSAKPEFSRPCAVARLPADGQHFAVVATEAERAALARRLDLITLDELAAEGELQPGPDSGLVELRGWLKASASQRCVVTLEPVPTRIETRIERLFDLSLDAGAAGMTFAEAEAAIDIDPEIEQPEPLPDGVLDLGEIAAEELAVALDPYPRAADADAVLAALGQDGAAPGPAGAFAPLDALRRH